MTNRRFGGAGLALSIAVGSLLLAGCGSDDASSGGKKLSFKLTDAGCDPAEGTTSAGPTTFEVTNDGASSVTEFEVLKGDGIVGERENLTDGLSGDFTVTLDPGDYTLYCPGGDEAERGTLTVRGEESSSSDTVGSQGAVDRYRQYLEEQTKLLVDRTRAFVKALNYGNVDQAKRLYPTTREPYEAVEPVAESFGNLDPEIDASEGDVPATSFRGFHRIEKALWEENTTKGIRSVAAKLLADIRRLQALVFTIKLEPAQIAHGANELLTEVSSSKITGEEERYSHTDLWDFDANVQGAKAAYDSVKPLLEQQDPQLAKELDERFAEVAKALAPYRRGDGFVLYGELTEQDKRQLAHSIDAVAEPLSQVAAIVVR